MSKAPDPDCRPRSPGPDIGHYNGWSPIERREGSPVQRQAIRDGNMVRPTICSICSSLDQVWLHDENYGDPLAAYPLCRSCHGVLHRRFEEPAPWLELVARHATGQSWFQLLSLDPACQYVPFARTYPDGLPSPSAESSGGTITMGGIAEPAAQAHRKAGLSKSRLTLFEQCPKRLWLAAHRPELAEESASTASGMRTGHEVGPIACALHPDGHMIENEHGLSAAAAETSRLLASGWSKPLFEATFVHEGVLVRVDLMLPAEDGWHVAEVKSTTGVKAYHLSDVATQLWVMRECGVRVASASIRHLNRGFVLEREGEFAGLFADTSVDEQVEPLIAGRPELVESARATLSGGEPVREVGAHCDDPFACSFKSYCSRDLPSAPEWPASLLPDAKGKKIAASYASEGIQDLLAVPASAMTSPKLARVHAATLTGEPFHDAAAIAAETSGWAYPRIFLDFETIQFAVPRWLGTRPYEQVPFQFSAHVEEQDGSVRHYCFLSTDGADPRRACAEALALLPSTGSVIAWNASFERGCLQLLADRFRDLAPSLVSLAARLVDLLPVVRRHYYHRDMRGSWSIKAVLPTVAPDLDYSALPGVNNGLAAQQAYFEAINPNTAPDRSNVIHRELLDYCSLDTRAMMVTLARLSKPPFCQPSPSPEL